MILNLENNWIMCSQLKDRNVCGILKILHLNMQLSWIQSYSSLNLNSSKESRKAFLRAQSVKNLPTRQETPVRFLGWKDPLEKDMSTHASILAWRIPRTAEPGRPVSRGSQESRHKLAIKSPPPPIHTTVFERKKEKGKLTFAKQLKIRYLRLTSLMFLIFKFAGELMCH